MTKYTEWDPNISSVTLNGLQENYWTKILFSFPSVEGNRKSLNFGMSKGSPAKRRATDQFLTVPREKTVEL